MVLISARSMLSAALLGTTVLPAGGIAAPAFAQRAEAERPYDIPAGTLAEALSRFADQSGVQLSYEAELGADRRSDGLQGRYTPAQALSRLLAGTGLVSRNVGTGSVTIARATTGSMTLDQVQVRGALVERDEQARIIRSKREDSRDTIIVTGQRPVDQQVAKESHVGMLGDKGSLDTPFNTTAYTSELIQNQIASSLSDVLANDPTIRTRTIDYYDNFKIRGFDVNRDGSTSFDGLYGIAGFEGIRLEGLDRVEVFRGATTFVNGLSPSGAIGGAINLVPKRAADAPLTRMTAIYQARSNFGGNFDVGRRFGGGQFGIRVNGAYSDGEVGVRGESRDLALGTIGLDFRSNRLKVSVDAGISRQVIHSYGGILQIAPNISFPTVPAVDRTYSQSWAFEKRRGRFAVGRVTFDATDDLQFSAAYGGQRSDRHILRPGVPRILNVAGDARGGDLGEDIEDRYATWSASIEARYKFTTGPLRHSLTVAANAINISYSSRDFQTAPGIYTFNIYGPIPMLPKPVFSTTRRVGDPADRLRSAAIADSISAFDDKVQLTVGVRHQNIDSPGATYDASANTPAFGLVLRPSAHWSLYGNYVEALQTGQVVPNDYENAGQTLPPSRAKQYEIGMKVEFGRFGATLALFQITQPSTVEEAGAGAKPILRLNGKQRNRGIEFQTYGEVVQGFRLLGGASYTEGVLVTTQDHEFDGNAAPNVPKWLVNLGAEWDTPFAKGLTLTARGIYTSHQFTDVGNIQVLPGFHQFDLGARYVFAINGQPVTLRASLENVTEERYFQPGITLSRPRSFLLSVSTDF